MDNDDMYTMFSDDYKMVDKTFEGFLVDTISCSESNSISPQKFKFLLSQRLL